MLNLFKFEDRSLEDQFILYGTGVTFLFMFPFALYRFAIGDLLMTAIDLLMASLMGVVFMQSWHSKVIKHLNYFVVVTFMFAILGVMFLKGIDMIFWAFPAMGATYFLLQSHHALFANIIFMGGTTLLYFDKLTKAEAMSVYPSLILVCFFGFIFGVRSERQNRTLFKLVSKDPLTGVKNRRSFDERIEEILANYARSPEPVSMLLLDLDYFKRVNDSYGHKKGDQVLIDFTQKVKSVIRTTDLIYRFGGEEFVVIAKNSSLENSGKIAESIREFIVQSPSLAQYKVTVSIGVSEISEKDDADSWFRRADRALYEAKGSGRNRVRLANLDESRKVYCEALRECRKTKTHSPEANNLIISKAVKKDVHNAVNYSVN